MTELNQSSGNGPSLPRVLTALPIPAQLTLMRSGPISSAMSRAADTDSGSVTLALANRARGPSSATTSSPLRSITTTDAPLSSRRLVVARPKPDAPPVTTATESLISTCRRSFRDIYLLVGWDYTQSFNTDSLSWPGTRGGVGVSV